MLGNFNMIAIVRVCCVGCLAGMVGGEGLSLCATDRWSGNSPQEAGKRHPINKKDLGSHLSPCFYWWASHESNTAKTIMENLVQKHFSMHPNQSQHCDQLENIKILHLPLGRLICEKLALSQEKGTVHR